MATNPPESGESATCVWLRVLGWQVTDIERQVAALQSRGVQFERFGFFEQDALGIWTAPGGDKVAWFKDPDGNVLSVSQHI